MDRVGRGLLKEISVFKDFCIHGLFHLQHLVLNQTGGRVHGAFTIVVEAVNLIKSNALQDRLFR